jgi:hypothetical protein
MKTVTLDMLRAHLKTASITAIVMEFLIWLASNFIPISEQTLNSTTFRLAALATVISGVIVVRYRAHAAFHLAIKRSHVTPYISPSRPVSVKSNCRGRWLVVLHLRSTGRQFVLE